MQSYPPRFKKLLVFKFHTHPESPVDLLWFMMMYVLLTKWQRWQFLPVFSCDNNAGCASPEIHGFCQHSRLNKQGLNKALGLEPVSQDRKKQKNILLISVDECWWKIARFQLRLVVYHTLSRVKQNRRWCRISSMNSSESWKFYRHLGVYPSPHTHITWNAHCWLEPCRCSR